MSNISEKLSDIAKLIKKRWLGMQLGPLHLHKMLSNRLSSSLKTMVPSVTTEVIDSWVLFISISQVQSAQTDIKVQSPLKLYFFFFFLIVQY